MRNFILEPFDEKNIPRLVERLVPLWGVEGMPEEFNRLYVEMIVRANMHRNRMQFQMCEGGELRAVAFFCRKGDAGFSGNDEWYGRTLERLDETGRGIFSGGRAYLTGMEEKVFSLMSADDLKLCLFVSLKSGWGKKILEESLSVLRGVRCAGDDATGATDHTATAPTNPANGRLFLWTDGECTVDWYFKNGFTLITQDEYAPFSTQERPYMTYVFKR